MNDVSDDRGLHRREVVPVPGGHSETPRRTCLLVLGMHRSGTSALTRVLSLAGAKLPRRLMGKGAGNEAGHWEPQVLVSYFDQFLAELGSAWHDWAALELSSLPASQKDAIRRDISEIIAADYPGASLFVVKDPRICRYAPLFIGALEHVGYRVVPILTFRNPLDVMRSLEARQEFWPDGYSRSDAALLWLRHVLDAEGATRGGTRAIIDYEGLLEDWRKALETIVEATGVSLPFSADDIAPDVEAFLQPDLRHHRQRPDDVVLDPMLRGWVSDAFEAMRILARSPGNTQALTRLDEVRQAFDDATPALRALRDSAEQAAAIKIGELSKQREDVTNERNTLAGRLPQLETELGQVRQALGSTVSERDSLASRSAELEAELGHVRQALGSTVSERDSLASRSAELEAELGHVRQALGSTVSERDSLASRSAELEAELGHVRQALGSTVSERDSLASRSAELEAELGSASETIGSLQQQLAVQHSDADAQRQARASAEAALSGLHQALASRRPHSQAVALISAGSGAVPEPAQVASIVDELVRELDDTSARFTQTRAYVADLEQQVAELERLRDDKTEALRDLNADLSAMRATMATFQSVLSNSHDQTAEAKVRAAEMERQVAAATGRAAALQGEIDAAQSRIRDLVEAVHHQLDATHRAYQSSTSWRLTAPIRGVKYLLTGSTAAPIAPLPISDLELHVVNALPPPEIVYFTICSRNFMAYARTLHASLGRFYPNVRFFVALCDDSAPAGPFEPSQEPFEFIVLDDLDLPEWREMSRRYNITEFNTAIKPFVFQYLFDKIGAENVIYFDPDIYVVDRLLELEEAFRSGATAILTPHMLEPAPDAEMNERRLLQYGIYNLGFLGLQRTPASRKLIDWWGRRLKTECIIKRDEGLFVDQKWADHFPAFLPGTLVLQHPGYNVAYWNLSSRKVLWTGERWEVNGLPLRFFHFSGNDLDNPECLSRHSAEHTTYTIGPLNALLDEYRRRIFDEGHEKYRVIPYAFSWEGAAGVNEHTPRPKFQQGTLNANPDDVQTVAAETGTDGDNSRVSTLQFVRTAVQISGGPGQLVKKTAKALRRGGLGQVKSRIDFVRRRAENQSGAPATAAVERPALLSWRKKALFIEWATPRPNQDSGSRTAFYFIEILTLLGYDVTFLPADMLHAGRYTQDLEGIGVTCIHGGIAGSVEAYLRQAGAAFDFVVLSRVHVAAPLLRHVETYCPQAKIIFNTVDLHYVRELRDAELAGARPDEALATKKAELGLVAAAEETIVLSHVERDELKREMPDAKVCVLPLVFSDIDPKPPVHGARKDILFIGSFPHKPNVDAVLAFARDVFPKLRARRPDIVWHIVGSEPTEVVLALANEPGIVVHGFVDDLTPLFRSVRLSIAPLRFGAGIKGKIATSLSYGVPVVASPIAVEGMEIKEGEQVCVAHNPDHWVETIVALYNDEARWSRMSESGQALTVAKYSVSSNALRVAEMMRRVDPDLGDMELFRFTSKREHDYLRSSFPEVVGKRESRELALLPAGEEAFNVEGFCATCGAPHSFVTSYMYACEKHASGRLVPNWREHLACDGCGFTMRLRAAMHLFFSRVYPGANASLYITERATPLFDWLKARHPNLTGSEYLGDKCALGQVSGGYRNEDLTRLTFADNSFDAILSFDVLEHVADDLAAFRECYRCLKPGGVLFFTAPFAFDKQDKVIRAELMLDGSINHILPPEIHGNPVDPDGALCFRYFGWDVLDDLKSVGFTGTEVLNYWSTSFAYLGKFGYVVVARKGTARG